MLTESRGNLGRAIMLGFSRAGWDNIGLCAIGFGRAVVSRRRLDGGRVRAENGKLLEIVLEVYTVYSTRDEHDN